MVNKITELENLLSNLSFLLLLLTTFYYWIKSIFFQKFNSKKFGVFGFLTSNVCITLLLIFRWINSGHFPLSNLYESLLFLAWGLISFYLFLEVKTKFDFLGIFVSPVVLFLIAFTTFSLPPELQESRPLVPALQSNWLFMHVSVMMLSYASLLVGCILSFGYLIFTLVFQKDLSVFSRSNRFTIKEEGELFSSEQSVFDFTLNSTIEEEISQSKRLDKTKLPAETSFTQLNSVTFFEALDSLSYRMVSIGFCFLTLGILSGAIWANETWGSYWSWDPKETWALITWLTFAIYLHTRLIQGWEGTKPAWIASFGFIIIWICYLGVNFLGKGLHSYGFLIT